MKNWLKLLLILSLAGPALAQKPAGREGHGGSDLTGDFMRIANEVHSILEKMPNEKLNDLNLTRTDVNAIAAQLGRVTVAGTDEKLFVQDDPEEKTAISKPDDKSPRIDYNNAKWANALTSNSRAYTVVTHELLNLAGKAKEDKMFNISSRFYSTAESVFLKKYGMDLSANEITERDYFREYLREIRREDGLRLLAQLQIQKSIYSAYDERWWADRDDKKQKERVKRYWDTFFDGRKAAEETVQLKGAGTNYCKLIDTIVQKTPPPSLEEDVPHRQAYKRGVVSRYPECFMENLKDGLKLLDAQVSNLSEHIFAYKRQAANSRPSNAELTRLSRELGQQIQVMITAEATANLPLLRSSIGVPTDVWSEVKMRENVIRARMAASQKQCPGVTPPEIIVREPLKNLDEITTLSILFKKKDIGHYQSRLDATGFIAAIHDYQRCIESVDPVILNNIAGMKTVLTSVDGQISRRLGRLQDRFSQRVNEVVTDFDNDNEFLWSRFYTAPESDSLIASFYLVREAIMTYGRLESGTDLEAGLLRMIGNRYNHALNEAASTTTRLNIPSPSLRIELNDEDLSTVDIPVSFRTTFEVHLLGQTSQIVDSWIQSLYLPAQ